MVSTAKDTNGNTRVTVTVNGTEADVVSANGNYTHFEGLKQTWDNHMAGIIVGFSSGNGQRPDRALAIQYENHFGRIKNVSIMTDTRMMAVIGTNETFKAVCEENQRLKPQRRS